MARPKEVIDIQLAEKAKVELRKITDYKICFRLQGIISSSKYPINHVASIMGISRVSLWRWINKFRDEGLGGLRDKPKGHNPSKLGEEERKQIKEWLSEGKDSNGKDIHWTLSKLIDEIERVFSIKVGMTPLWRIVRKLGFRQKVPRPMHAKSDPDVQEAFKKKLLK